MTSTGYGGPFDQVHEEIHLSKAPLVRVLSQIRWDDLTTFRSGFESNASALGQAIAEDYPISAKIDGVQFAVGPLGVSPQPADPVHKFSSPDETWRVYLGPNFITLETGKYTSKEDFGERFEKVLQALTEIASIPRAIRVGFRYVNRIDASTGFDQIDELVIPDVLGGFAVPHPSDIAVQHSLTESLYLTPTGTLLARWAVLPSNGMLDPTIEGVEGPSWVLDLDAFDEKKPEFVPSDLVRRIKSLSVLGYGFFRWAVTQEFLERFGGRDANS